MLELYHGGHTTCSRKARLWDAYVARWQVKTRRNEGGLVDVFMQYFADCYERGRK